MNARMPDILEARTYDEVQRRFSWDAVWALFDGTPERMNVAHECIDRHRGKGTAVSVKFADGRSEHYGFDELADLTGRFANWLARRGVARGDRVAVIVDPSRAFYVGMFGAMKYGAIAVPMFTLFGPEGLALRLNDCKPKLALTQQDPAALQAQFPGMQVVRVDERFWAELAAESPEFTPSTSASDLALFQYTSGTTRELPDAVKHTHRAPVTLMVAALYGLGLRPGDRYFCPSSPAWGHGLAHGTISPLALGIHTAAYSGRFDAGRILEALEEFAIDNMAAAPTVFRMLRNSGLRERYRIALRKISYAGEPMDPETMRWAEASLGALPCSMYGTTEVGVLIVNYPGLEGYRVKPGALGKPAPGMEVAVVDREGRELATGERGEIAVKRKSGWFFAKDLGWRDEEGYFHIEGRSDDVIISAGWTMSAVEIENTLLKHPKVLEAAVIGVPDPVRGQIPKAYLVAREAGAAVAKDIQEFMKRELSKHEYPRDIEFVAELPKTPAGKVNRRALRDAARSASKQESEMAVQTLQREFVGITDEALAELRKRIGVKIESTVEPWCYEATRDNIRHYAHGIGDDNPLWCDPEYARKTRHGDLIAPPSFLFACDRVISGYVGGLPGVHAMFAGCDFEWHKPIRRNARITASVYLKDLVEHDTRFAGRAIQQIYHGDFYDETGDLLASADTWCFRTDRDIARESGTKYQHVRAKGHKVYTDEELERLYAYYEREEVRGANPRYWEDVAVGTNLPTMLKGPMTVTGFIAYVQGWGSLYIRAHKLAWQLIRKHPKAGIKNRFGIPDIPERVHWEPELALKVGAPGAYDYGPERCSWMSHAITNWIGDDGMLRKLHCQIRRHNPEGDTLFINGSVTRKFEQDGRKLVEFELLAENQDGERSAVATAVAELPSRSR